MPRVKMTPMVKIALIVLRVYLVVLLTLIAVAAIKAFRSGSLSGKKAESPSPLAPVKGSAEPAKAPPPPEADSPAKSTGR
jgi:hypothetical protein